jgi:hypothetical protein
VSRAAITVLLALALSPSANAYSIAGRPWPGGQVLYYNAAADQAWAVQRAAAAWNASGARVRFVPVPQSRAQLVIRTLPGDGCTRPDATVEGLATVGQATRATVWIARLDTSTQKCNAYSSAQTLAHELGHVLRLGHESRGCATMNPAGTVHGPEDCTDGAPWTWDCGLLHLDDVRGVVALYGGAPRPPRAAACDLYAASAPPGSLQLAGAGVPGAIVATFTRPAIPRAPLFLARDAGSSSYVLQVQRDRCAAEPDLDASYRWRAQPGGIERSTATGLARGTYCVAVWAVDGLGRPSARPATAWIRMT